MRVGAIADLHGYLPEIPKGLDLLLVAGDVGAYQGEWLESFQGYSEKLSDLAAWIESAGCPVVAIAGNHDFAFRHDGKMARDLPWTYLLDESATVCGVEVHGSPWCNKFGDWAFMDTDENLARRWALIPEDTEILLTHGPPHGYGDKVSRGDLRVGSETLTQRLGELPALKLHVFGHIHEAKGRWNVNGAVLANVAYVGPGYQPWNNIQVFNLDH